MANSFIQSLAYGQGKPLPQEQPAPMPMAPKLSAAPTPNYAAPSGGAPGMAAPPPAQPAQGQYMGTNAGMTPQAPNLVSDADWAKMNEMYNYANPTLAFQNAMRDLGYNPLAANPFVRNLSRAASGLGQAWLQNQATAAPGTSIEPTHMGTNFRQYLIDAISSAGGHGIYSRLAEAGRNIPNVVRSMRQYETDLGNGGLNAMTLNPFMGALHDSMSAGLGEGTVNAINNLLTPGMNAQMAGAFRTGLSNQMVTGLRQMGPQDDIWKYLIGV